MLKYDFVILNAHTFFDLCPTMTNEIKIQRVNNTEVEELRALGEATFRETFGVQNTKENLDAYLAKSFSLANVEAQLKSPGSEFYFASLNEKTVAYLKLNTSDKGLEIERIYVIGSAQGQCIGKALFQFSLNLAKSRESTWIWLGVWQENVKAVEFYKRQGMEVFDTRQFQLGSELQDDFLMRLLIS